MEDYNSFVNEIFKFFSGIMPGEINDTAITKELNQRFNSEIERYLDYYDSFKEHINNKYFNHIKKLIIIRILARDIWDIIHDSYDPIKYDHQKYRISAIGKILHRVLLTTDENINLFRNGMGISILSNCRMILESYSYAIYLDKIGEIEADRFQDYSIVQSNQINGKNNENLFRDKYQDDFFKPYGWISDKKSRSLINLVNKLEDDKYIKYYRILSNFVHASPYSIEVSSSLANPEKNMEEHHFPLSFHDSLRINIKLLSDFIVLIINSFIMDDKESYHFTLNAVLKWF